MRQPPERNLATAWAAKIIPVVKNQHLLLCTLLTECYFTLFVTAHESFQRRHYLTTILSGIVWIGLVSGKAIFGQPLEEYWSKKLQQEAATAAAAAKDNDQPSQV